METFIFLPRKKCNLNCIFFCFCEVIYKIIYIFAVLENT